MKVVILAGGFGTRLGELTHSIPKPMAKIGQRPIVWHIMSHYSSHGYNDFILALGYKSEEVKDYFLNYSPLNSDFTVDLATGNVEYMTSVNETWKVTLVDTGLNTMTGGRLARLTPLLDGEPFMLTYGDGLSDVNISKLVEFHESNKRMVTVTTVHPGARFGELEIQESQVRSFKEKPQTTQGWINGGFFVMNPEFLKYIESDATVLEAEPLETVSKQGELSAFKHEGFWQCMDNVRDYNYLNELWDSGEAPWVVGK